MDAKRILRTPLLWILVLISALVFGMLFSQSGPPRIDTSEAMKQITSGNVTSAKLINNERMELTLAKPYTSPDGSVKDATSVYAYYVDARATDVVKALDAKQPAQGVVADTGASGAHQRDLLGEETAADEPENLGRGLVEPLGVLDDADQRLLLCNLGHQRQGGQPHQEPVRGRTFAQPEDRGQRVALRDGQAVKVLQHRRTQLMEAGVREFHLRLHAPGPRDLPAVDPVGEVAQQGALAHARLAAEDDDSARTGEDVSQELVQRRTLATASEERPGLTATLARRWHPCASPPGNDPVNRIQGRAYICDRG